MYKFEKCPCGNSVMVRTNAVSVSAACIKCIRAERKRLRPLMNRAKSIWRGMMERCSNPRCKEWKNYGGRGISVSKRWLSFENFIEDMGLPGEGMSIERINVNAGYSRSNCKWIPRNQQNRNKRDTKLTEETAAEVSAVIQAGGVVKGVAMQYGISESHARKVSKGRYWKAVCN